MRRKNAAKDVQQDKNALILVLGIHRVLSSCLAECLELLGVYMGDRTRGGEDEKLAEFCEHVLPFPSVDLRMEVAGQGSYRERPCLRQRWFREWLAMHRAAANGAPFGAKYPTLCALVTELSQTTRLKTISLERPLEQSVQSLVDRSATIHNPKLRATPEECLKLQTYLENCKRDFLYRYRPYLTVQAQDLLQYPARELNRVIEYLNIKPSWRQYAAAVDHVVPNRASHTPKVRSIGRWTDHTTVCIKTFERPKCLDQCVRSIRARHPAVPILVADDSKEPMTRSDCQVILLPYDTGLAEGRNIMVRMAETPYVLILDDDMSFLDETRIEALWDVLHWGGYDVVAGEVRSKTLPRLFAGHFDLNLEKETLFVHSGPVPNSDPSRWHVVENFFVAKTDVLKRVPWLPEQKMGEHIVWCIDAWEAKLKIGRVGGVICNDSSSHPSPLYTQARRRVTDLRNRKLVEYARRLGFRHLFHDAAIGVRCRDITSR